MGRGCGGGGFRGSGSSWGSGWGSSKSSSSSKTSCDGDGYSWGSGGGGRDGYFFGSSFRDNNDKKDETPVVATVAPPKPSIWDTANSPMAFMSVVVTVFVQGFMCNWDVPEKRGPY